MSEVSNEGLKKCKKKSIKTRCKNVYFLLVIKFITWTSVTACIYNRCSGGQESLHRIVCFDKV
jgi:hypothetical protein